MNLRCPWCGAEISPILEYTSGSYSEHRDHNGYECDDCFAQWDRRGNVTKAGGKCSYTFPTPGGLAAECGLLLPCSLHGEPSQDPAPADGDDTRRASAPSEHYQQEQR